MNRRPSPVLFLASAFLIVCATVAPTMARSGGPQPTIVSEAPLVPVGSADTCTPNSTTLCLNNGRFRVTATFLTPQGQTGNARAVAETTDTGLFWFFSASNIEVIVKVVDACSFAAGPRYWVFAGGLTNVQVVLTVTDTQTGIVRTYTNAQGEAFQPIQDTDAFATCPASPGFAQTALRPAPEIVSSIQVMRPSGVATGEVLSQLNKGDVHPLSPTRPQECTPGSPIECGSSVTGQLTTTDCTSLTPGDYRDYYLFDGTAGQTVTIDMASTDFDTDLWVGPDSPRGSIAHNDNVGDCNFGQVGGCCNSRIASFTLDAPGTWIILATSASFELGAYTLTLACPGGGEAMCSQMSLLLNNARFRVQVDWAAPNGTSGSAAAVSETYDTGLFWFFSPNNIEMIVKVVDGCAFNSRYWVFAGGLTNVAYTITVTDTNTGIKKTYSNPQGTPSQPVQDTNAFVCS